MTSPAKNRPKPIFYVALGGVAVLLFARLLVKEDAPQMEAVSASVKAQAVDEVGPDTAPVKERGPNQERKADILAPIPALQTNQDAHQFFGIALDSKSEAPVGGARISFTRTNGGDDQFVITDKDGRFSLPLDGRNSYPALIEGRGYGPLIFATTALLDDHEHPAVLRLQQSACLRARVMSASGGGIPGIQITLRANGADLIHQEGQIQNPFLLDDNTWSAITDANGEAFLEDLAAGANLAVELRSAGRVVLKSSRACNLAAGQELQMEFVIGFGATLLGHLTDASGAPVSNTEIWRISGVKGMTAVLRPDQRTSVLQKVQTDANGAFEMSDVPVGTWWVGPAPSDTFAGDAAIAIVEASTILLDVELLVHRGLFLAGTVIGPEGPVKFARVQARQLDGRLVYVSGFAREGAFSLGPLVPGSYQILPGAEGLIGRGITATAGDRDLLIEMTAGAVLRGQVLDAITGESVTASIRVQKTSATHKLDSVGGPSEVGSSFEFSNLTPVEYAMIARTRDGRIGVLRAVADPTGSVTSHEILVSQGMTLVLQAAGESAGGFLTVWQDDAFLFGNGMRPHDRKELTVPAGDVLLTWRPRVGDEFERIVSGSRGSRINVDLTDS